MNWFRKKQKSNQKNKAIEKKTLRNRKLASDLLEISFRENEFNSFLYGDPFFSIDGRDPNGESAPTLYYNRDAIYQYSVAHPESNLCERIEDTMIDELQKYDSDAIIDRTLNVIETFLMSEINSSPFVLDFSKTLEIIKRKISKNKNLFCEEKEASWINYPNFYEYLRARAKSFDRIYGISFMSEYENERENYSYVLTRPAVCGSDDMGFGREKRMVLNKNASIEDLITKAKEMFLPTIFGGQVWEISNDETVIARFSQDGDDAEIFVDDAPVCILFETGRVHFRR